MDCEKNTHAMILVVVSKKNTHAMTLVDPCVVTEENTHFSAHWWIHMWYVKRTHTK